MWYSYRMNKEIIKDGPYYIYKGIRIFKKRNGFVYVYWSQLPAGNFAHFDTYPDTLKKVIADIDNMFNVYPLAVAENYRLKLIKKGN